MERSDHLADQDRRHTVTIREAHGHESGPLACLIRRCLAEFQGDLPAPTWAALSTTWPDPRRLPGRVDVLVASLDGRLVGTATLHADLRGSRSRPAPPDWATVACSASIRHSGDGESDEPSPRRVCDSALTGS